MERKSELVRWQAELEGRLNTIDSTLKDLNRERNNVQSQLTAIKVLLSPTGDDSSSSPDEKFGLKVSYKLEAMSAFLDRKKNEGWAISQIHGKSNTYCFQMNNTKLHVWMKYSSKINEKNLYWYGITPASLASMTNKQGFVVLLLGKSTDYVSVSFQELQKMLLNATAAKTGYKFNVRKTENKIELQPTGSGSWIDVTPYYQHDI